MNQLIVIVLFLASNVVSANSSYTIKTYEVPVKVMNLSQSEALPFPVDPGIVLGWGKDIVALGESVYNLVQKGKPVINTQAAAINVVPRFPGTNNYVHPMDLEEASDPIKRSFVMVAKNAFGKEVLRFEYMLIYQVAKYEGHGRYILNAIILPKVKASYGIDFSAEMRHIGSANKGTKADPVISVILNMHYKIGSVVNAFEANDAITFTGAGKVNLN